MINDREDAPTVAGEERGASRHPAHALRRKAESVRDGPVLVRAERHHAARPVELPPTLLTLDCRLS
jgi:hypothetical protein